MACLEWEEWLGVLLHENTVASLLAGNGRVAAAVVVAAAVAALPPSNPSAQAVKEVAVVAAAEAALLGIGRGARATLG